MEKCSRGQTLIWCPCCRIHTTSKLHGECTLCGGQEGERRRIAAHRWGARMAARNGEYIAEYAPRLQRHVARHEARAFVRASQRARVQVP